jgi:hypothetical protein
MSILQSKLKYVGGGIEVIYLFSFLFLVTWQSLCKKGLLEVICMNFPLLVDFTLGNVGYVDLNYIKIWLKWKNTPPPKSFHLEDSDYIAGLPLDVAGNSVWPFPLSTYQNIEWYTFFNLSLKSNFNPGLLLIL